MRSPAPASAPVGVSVPKRLRYFMQRDGVTLNLVAAHLLAR